MKKKRKVSKNLGRTQHYQADSLYRLIAKKSGPTRKCPFYGGSKYPQFDSKSHNLLNPKYPNPNVPIEQFDFCKKEGKWDLQAYCKVCYKVYRDARINFSRKTWMRNRRKMTDSQIRDWYKKNVGPTMQCSACKRELSPENFRISRSMEKGLHNICFNCEMSFGESSREKEWLSEGDWKSWKSAVVKMRRTKKVKCAGWKRSVLSGDCKIESRGKNMHADHIIPLRAGGIHDVSNFQPLCSVCNEKKSDQIDPLIKKKKIISLVCNRYKKYINISDSIETIERKLKFALEAYLSRLVKSKSYLGAIKKKKKQVNGQWDPKRIYKKGIDWLTKVQAIRKK